MDPVQQNKRPLRNESSIELVETSSGALKDRRTAVSHCLRSSIDLCDREPDPDQPVSADRTAQNKTHKRVLQQDNMNTTDRSGVRGHHEERGVQSVGQVSSTLLLLLLVCLRRWTHLLHSEEQRRTPDRSTVRHTTMR